ncbi:RNA chaperone Hfq [Streptomyces sp. CT34]|uniref:RNA chaperone Hfq n=1 Tax=Streptomyces sp. CT34 TaxID=1553907 RepID=UPI000AAAE2C8|nr:RNA chaperone Hfq [Streptomyces sp. CT34]
MEEKFLSSLVADRVPVTIYLTNGSKLQGLIVGVDTATILLRDHLSQLVYKNAISTIVPSRPVEGDIE